LLQHIYRAANDRAPHPNVLFLLCFSLPGTQTRCF